MIRQVGGKRGNLNYNEFVEVVKEGLQRRLGSSYEVVLKKVTKNNDVCRYGISLFCKEAKDNKKVSRIIYLEDFYREFCENQSYELSSIQDELYDIFMDFTTPKFDERDYTDIGIIKDRIIFELVNFEMNKGRLSGRPYIKVMDLAVIFAFVATDLGKDFGVVHITNEIADQFGLSSAELWEIAKKNTPKLLAPDVVPMSSFIPAKDREEDIEEMYIVCNKRKSCGAGVILYDKILDRISSDLESDLYILPSSIHETIIIKDTKDKEVSTLQDMVQNINNTVVSDEDVLSDKVYCYYRNSKKLEIA